jgi:hypothetical protein
MGIKPETVRAQRASELLRFSQLLDRSRVFVDSSPLQVAAARCRTEKPNGNAEMWGYSLQNLLFRNVASRRHLRPSKVDSLTVSLSVTIAGHCITDDPDCDPLSRLEVNFDIRGIKAETSLIATWHLDRHIFDQGDNPSDEGVHPLYHFQFGGRKTWHEYDNGSLNFGSALFLDPPRLPHPPMDAVLAIDFVLSNFDWGTWNKLTQQGEYRNLVREHQRRFWQPYARTCAAWATTLDRSHWSVRSLWPQVI